MSNTTTILSGGLGGVSASYATPDELKLLSMPQDGERGYITTPTLNVPLNVNGLTLKVTVTEDGIDMAQYTFTFPANYTTVDALVGAIAIPRVQAINYSGKLRLQTVKAGISQGIRLAADSTANPVLGFNTIIDDYKFGSSSASLEFSNDEMVFALSSASRMADSYLSRRYNLPLLDWNIDLKQAVCDIAAYILIFRRGYSPQSGSYDANFKVKHDMSVNWLSEVGNRNINPAVVESGHRYSPNAEVPFVDALPGRDWGSILGISYGYGPCGGCC